MARWMTPTEADWTLQARIDAALVETGLPALPPDRLLASLSGGERTRVALARLLIEAPDVLLLDEPTNNLDADGREAVAYLLERWRGGVVVASHDRALLERVNRIVELTPVGVTVFGGAWPEFAEARDAAGRARRPNSAGRPTPCASAERAVQKAKEKKARRDKAGRAWRAKGIDDKMFLDAEQQRAENSGARESHIADRMIDDRAEALAEARARVEVLTPLSIDLPKTGLPDSRELVAFKDVVMALRRPAACSARCRSSYAVPNASPSAASTAPARRRCLRLMTGQATARFRRCPPSDRSRRRARPARRPARPGSKHSRQPAPPKSRSVRQRSASGAGPLRIPQQGGVTDRGHAQRRRAPARGDGLRIREAETAARC